MHLQNAKDLLALFSVIKKYQLYFGPLVLALYECYSGGDKALPSKNAKR